MVRGKRWSALKLISSLSLVFLALQAHAAADYGRVAIPKQIPGWMLDSKWLNFANDNCSRNYAQMDNGHQALCERLITAYCSDFNTSQDTVETVPYWRPTAPPVAYFRYLKSSQQLDKLHNHFTCALYSHVNEANYNVLVERSRLIDIADDFKNGKTDFRDVTDLRNMMSRYDVPFRGDSISKQQISQLLKKVDVVPISLVLAQAAVESDWGTSRFAEIAYNLFGRHALLDCKVNVECVAAGARVRLIKYANLSDAIADQVLYLNRHPAYPQFRDIRWDERTENRTVTGAQLSHGLLHYAAISNYPQRLTSVIQANHWNKYDGLSLYYDHQYQFGIALADLDSGSTDLYGTD